MKTNICDVFIIETLDPDDEGNGRLEGVVLSSILRMDIKNPIYRYVRTKKQFEAALAEYKDSKYRYLHISAHGNKKEIALTNSKERYSHKELATVLSDCSRYHRLFISSCLVVNEGLADELSKQCDFYSVIGPSVKLTFSEGALFWASFYHVIFKMDDSRMRSKDMRDVALKLQDLYQVKLDFYKFDSNDRAPWEKLI